MITKITGEQPFQVLTNNFSISPSQEGYTLQISADGKQYSNLFTVGAGVTRLVTGVAANSYYRLSGNQSQVSINWMKTCVTEGGSGGSGTELTPVSEFPLDVETGTVVAYNGSASATGIYMYDGTDWVAAGGDVDLSAYWTSAQTEDAISAATAGKADAAEMYIPQHTRIPLWNRQGIITGTTGYDYYNKDNSINGITYTALQTNNQQYSIYGPTTPGTAGQILVSTGSGAPVWSAVTMGGNSPIIPAITTQAEYEAISGNLKTGDLIQVYGVVLNGYDGPQYGLFEAAVVEEESDGVVRKLISWGRKDNSNSVLLSENVYPWMGDNDIVPVDFLGNEFLISPDFTVEDEAYNGIGFDSDGKPVITHIVPQFDEQTGEITGITREDTPIGGSADMSAYYTSAQTEDAISAATSGKADAANLSTGDINRGDLWFPNWNEQGIITGKTGLRNFQIRFDVNGIQNRVTSPDTGYIPSIWAATNAGTAGDILVSTGNGAPVWSAVTFPDVSNYVTSAQVETQILEKNYITSAATANMVTSTSVSTIWKGTTAEYNAIVNKDPQTLYIIVDNV